MSLNNRKSNIPAQVPWTQYLCHNSCVTTPASIVLKLENTGNIQVKLVCKYFGSRLVLLLSSMHQVRLKNLSLVIYTQEPKISQWCHKTVHWFHMISRTNCHASASRHLIQINHLNSSSLMIAASMNTYTASEGSEKNITNVIFLFSFNRQLDVFQFLVFSQRLPCCFEFLI